MISQVLDYTMQYDVVTSSYHIAAFGIYTLERKHTQVGTDSKHFHYRVSGCLFRGGPTIASFPGRVAWEQG